MFDDARLRVMELAGEGYSCAQIVLCMGLDLLGRENPGLVRSMSGLAMGARYGSICGALTGGLCLIALHTGKGRALERPLPQGTTLMDSLLTWFIVEELGGEIEPNCAEILESRGRRFDLSAGPSSACADLAAHIWTKAVFLLREYGLDPARGREED